MKSKHLLLFAIYLGCAFFLQYVSAQWGPSHRYCFQFTWILGEYDNTTTFADRNCSVHLESIGAVGIGVPCKDPLLITNDQPDIDFLLENYVSEVTTRCVEGRVCAKYSYSFNHFPRNITYMCTQAFSTGQGPVTNDCFQQTIDGQQVEVCLCQSVKGYMPCNGATSLKISVTLLVILALFKYVLNIQGD